MFSILGLGWSCPFLEVSANDVCETDAACREKREGMFYHVCADPGCLAAEERWHYVKGALPFIGL